MDLLALRKLFAALVLPPTGPLIVALAGLALAGRRRRLGLALAWLGAGSLLALSLPIVSHALLGLVDHEPPLDPARARDAQAIVILGGGVRVHAPEYGGATLGRLTLERVRYGALLARRTALPVLVSGGALYGGATEAALMKRALEEEYNVVVRWTEARSRDTRSNATESAALLLPARVERVLLVAHGFDMPRATAEFAAARIQAIPAPTVIRAPAFTVEHPLELMPGIGALQGSYYALYELLGEAARRLRAFIA